MHVLQYNNAMVQFLEGGFLVQHNSRGTILHSHHTGSCCPSILASHNCRIPQYVGRDRSQHSSVSEERELASAYCGDMNWSPFLNTSSSSAVQLYYERSNFLAAIGNTIAQRSHFLGNSLAAIIFPSDQISCDTGDENDHYRLILTLHVKMGLLLSGVAESIEGSRVRL